MTLYGMYLHTCTPTLAAAGWLPAGASVETVTQGEGIGGSAGVPRGGSAGSCSPWLSFRCLRTALAASRRSARPLPKFLQT